MQAQIGSTDIKDETGLSSGAPLGAQGEVERATENRPYAGTDPRPDTSEVPRPAD